MSQTCRRFLLILFISISLLPAANAQDLSSSRPPQPPQVKANVITKTLNGRQIYRRLLNSTGWIVTKKSDSRSYSGTGWIVDADQRLFVTCHHVIARAKSFVVLFPDFRQGKLVTDPRHYQRHVRGVRGKIIDSDPRCDLALVQLESIPKNMRALPLAKQSAMPSDRLHVVGGKPRGSEALWTYGRGVARSVNQQTIANGYRIQILQSQDGSDRGNSGGAVLNDSGKVVAVVQGGVTNARNVGLNVDLSELKRYLKAGSQDSAGIGTARYTSLKRRTI